MNREQARKNWEVIKAYGEGKELQYRKVGEKEWHDERKNLGFCFDVDDCEFRIKPEENHTIEQNCGENRVEGGVLSVSGSVSEKHYRPFKDCDELIEHYKSLYKKKTGLVPIDVGLDVPYIWVKHKQYGTENLITAFDNDNESIGGSCVFIQDMWCDMAELFEQYTFLDNSACGVEDDL